MINLTQISAFFPQNLRAVPGFSRYALREYIQLLILDYLSTSPWVDKIVFIGGSNLRLVKGIDRFSEDLDFDHKGLSEDEFMLMTDKVIDYLNGSGLTVEARDKDSSRLTAFRRNLYFPELLFSLNLSGYREERFLIKMEAQDQGIDYQRVMSTIEGCGFRFLFPTPPDAVLLSMKLSAILSRSKGRDFYDAMFLWQYTQPDYDFLKKRVGISTPEELLQYITDKMQLVDMTRKRRDFEHLLFRKENASRILSFAEFVKEKLSHGN